MNFFSGVNDSEDKESDFDKFDPDKNFTFEDNCEYVYNTNSNTSKESEISVINFNIRSIQQNFKKFTDLISNSNTNFDVIALTETWLSDDSCLEDYTITGYHPPIVQNRKDGSGGGGVVIYLRETFESYNIMHKLSHADIHNNILTVKALKNKKSHYISVCYRSPSSDNLNFLDNFESVVSGIRNKPSIITGDFNYNLFNIQHHAETSKFYNIMTSNVIGSIKGSGVCTQGGGTDFVTTNCDYVIRYGIIFHSTIDYGLAAYIPILYTCL